MSTVWNATNYDDERRRLIYCFDDFYGAVAELIVRCCPDSPRILDLGAGTGLLSTAIVERIPTASLHLLDASPEMLERAAFRLAKEQPEISVQLLTEKLPQGPFNAIVSALSIHHLGHEEKRSLFRRIFNELAPEGLFINAEQVSGQSARLQHLFESIHLDRARALGSSEEEINRAIERMNLDQCATVSDQVVWLQESGFEDVECLYRSFRFAVIAAWKPAS